MQVGLAKPYYRLGTVWVGWGGEARNKHRGKGAREWWEAERGGL